MNNDRMCKVDLRSVRRLKRAKDASPRPGKALVIIGDDVQFNLNLDEGVWRGVMTSEMARDHEGRRILAWILRKDFDDDAKEIIKEQLGELHF